MKQVVARTFEVGARNSQEGRLRWNIDFFHIENYNDLLFVASEQTGFGFFDNFGKTRRQGLEANFDARISQFVLGGQLHLSDRPPTKALNSWTAAAIAPTMEALDGWQYRD